MRILRVILTNDWLAAGVVFAFALVVAITPSLIWGIPRPFIHDEFSYLLAGDTFAHFRLTNPTPPAWQSFETFHEIFQPTYASKFPPGQGMALAIGFWVGQPIVGVWLSVALACVAVWWTLRAVVEPGWALVGGLICAIYPAVFWWGQCYWGGAVAMIGGALLTGGAIRAMRDPPRTRDGLFMGAGVAVLAISRPFEGAIVAGFVGIFLLTRSIVRKQLRLLLLRGVLPASAVLLPTFAWMGYYNWRVTGDALLMPYQEHDRQYLAAGVFYWQPTRPTLAFHSRELWQFHARDELAEFDSYRSRGGFVAGTLDQLYLLRIFVQPWGLIVPFALGCATARRNRNVAFAIGAVMALLLVHFICTPWMRIAYMGPIVAPLIIVMVCGFRVIWHWRVFALPVGRAAMAIIVAWQILAAVDLQKRERARTAVTHANHRAELVERLERQPGRHLVFVRYSPEHNPLAEWVFNGADIASQKVILARYLDPEANRAAIAAYPGRRVWGLEADSTSPVLTEFPAAGLSRQ